MLTSPVPLTSGRRRSISRADDRRITFAGVAVAVGLLGLAMAALALPESSRRGLWLPLHLALAGAAATAIASVLPFFTAALAVAPPAGRPARILAIGAIAGGALTVSGGVAAGVTAVAVGGGLGYLVGLAALAFVAFSPLRGALGPRRPLVTRAYAVAVGCVAAGVALSTAYLAGWSVVVERWGLLKPAHAWLDLVGFLSLVVAATLVHLAPTVAGTRMHPRTSARIAIIGVAVGAPIVAVGLALAIDGVVGVGALTTFAGAVALTRHAGIVQRERGAWTTDPGWHRLTSWSLVLGPAWFAVGIAIAGGRFLSAGADATAWDAGTIAAALVIGWIVQVMVGSWSHLLPAIGPGDPAIHARQRTILGRAATVRILVLNAGVALATIGAVAPATGLVTIGLVLSGGSLVAALILFMAAVRRGDQRPTPPVAPARV